MAASERPGCGCSLVVSSCCLLVDHKACGVSEEASKQAGERASLQQPAFTREGGGDALEFAVQQQRQNTWQFSGAGRGW